MHKVGLIPIITSAALLLFFAANPVAAQHANAEGWRFSVGSYLWLSAIDGDRSLQPASTPVQFGGSSLFGGGSSIGLSAELGKGHWSVILDGFSVGTSDEIEAPSGAAGSSHGSSDLSLQRGEVLLGRRLGSAADPTGFELLGGLRYTRFRQETRDDSVEGLRIERQWIDPIIGARFTSRPDHGIGFMTSWEVGGFGVGSVLSWGLETGVIIQWSETVDLLIGYRLSDVDYEQHIGTPDAFVYNGTVRGLRTRLSLNL